MCTVPVFSRVCRESYSDPRAVYDTLKHRGMNLVTITDHDSIEAAESLRGQPEFFLSEEVSAISPSGTRLHMGVYDIQERHHVEIQQRREDLMALIAYLGEQRLFFTINHIYSSLTGPRTESDFALFAACFPGVETLNGQMPALSNRKAAELAARQGKVALAGSDAHTLASLGKTYTYVAGARNKQEFLQGLQAGKASSHGEHGSYSKLTRAVWALASDMMRENRWTLLLLPLAAAVPVVTFANCIREMAFLYKWAAKTVAVGRPKQFGARGWIEARS